ncbi:uncharacterized protein LOC126278098 isoform X2 [Schistocerca gregaria]|uniref:uncharacterized protein LOC126278098 isoform X2 n=1 Tax=Schistocerca gregaria TaxID=7010 RepID=UPI00211EAE38|nr:uncharacterized protein LOC126278098 isoform X2 [Schistocerca gregaria]
MNNSNLYPWPVRPSLTLCHLRTCTSRWLPSAVRVLYLLNAARLIAQRSINLSVPLTATICGLLPTFVSCMLQTAWKIQDTAKSMMENAQTATQCSSSMIKKLSGCKNETCTILNE